MPTKFYLHNALNNVPGTLPTGEQATATPDYTLTGATTNRLMNTGIGTSQSSLTGSSAALSTLQGGLLGMWVSPAMNAGTIGGGAINFSIAGLESNAASNFWPNSLNIYVWRPSNGTKVGTVRDSTGTSLGGTEVGTSQTTVYISGITSSAVTMAAGDVIVVEVWSAITQSMATAYTNTIFFDGTTENITNGSASTNIASFVEFTENVTFAPVVLNITGNSSAGQVNGITFLKLGNIDASGNLSAGSIGSVSTGVGYNLTSVTSVGSVGNLTRSSAVTISISGVSSEILPGNTSIRLTSSISGTITSSSVSGVAISMSTGITLSGVSSTGSLGNVLPILMVSTSGNAAGSDVGSINALTGKAASLTSVSSSGSVGTLTRSSAVTISISGVSSAVLLGNETAVINLSITGNDISTSVGTIASSTFGGIVFANPTSVSASGILGTFAIRSVTPAPYQPSLISYIVSNKFISGSVSSKWGYMPKESFPYLEVTISAKNVQFTPNRNISFNASIPEATGMQAHEFSLAAKSIEFVVPDQAHTSN